MDIGIYCNWGLREYRGCFYIPSYHEGYINAFKERSDNVTIMSKVRREAPDSNFIKIESVDVVPIPDFYSYSAAFKYCAKIVAGARFLLSSSDLIYIRVPEPLAWVFGFLSIFYPSSLHFHYVSFPFEVIDSYKESKLKKYIKKILYVPEHFLVSFFAYFHSASSLGENGVRKLPFWLRKKAMPLYEASYREGYVSPKKSSSIKLDSKIRIIFVGRLVPGKGLEELISSIVALNEKERAQFKFTIAGDGVLRRKLEDMVVENDLSNIVEFVGFVKFGGNLDRLYCENDVLVSPSFSETGPRTVLEASANYMYIISTDVGYVKELSVNGNNMLCHLTAPGDVEQLTQAFRFVLNNPRLCEICANQFHESTSIYSLDKFIDSVIDNCKR